MIWTKVASAFQGLKLKIEPTGLGIAQYPVSSISLGPTHNNVPCTCLASRGGRITIEYIYDACPKYSELGSFRIIAYLYVSDGSRS